MRGNSEAVVTCLIRGIACKAILSAAVVTRDTVPGLKQYGKLSVRQYLVMSQLMARYYLNFLNDNRDNGNNIYIAQGCGRVVSVVPVGLCCHLKTDTTLSTKKQTGRHSLLREHLPVCFFHLLERGLCVVLCINCAKLIIYSISAK